MAYAAGDSILDDHYNGFLSGSSAGAYGINHIMGTGSGEYGLGLTEIVGTSAGTTITAAKWNTLFTNMDNIANHTNDSLSSTPARSAGDEIAFISALQTDLNTLAASVAAVCPNATALSEGSELQSSPASSRWNDSHIVEHSITFSSNAHLRYFFNAGGSMRMKMTRTGNGGSSNTDKDDSVDEMLSLIHI